MPQSQTSAQTCNNPLQTSAKPCNARGACRSDCANVKPAQDPLAALERARRLAFEAQEAERWDGLS